MKKIQIILLLALITEFSFAADPSGITIQSGSAINGNTIVITGANFGSNSLNYTWTGSNIESGTLDAVFDGGGNWNTDSSGTYNNPPIYSDDDAHSGSKSIKSTFSGVVYNSVYRYDTGTYPSNIYATWWAKIVNRGDDGQWKVMKWMCDDGSWSVSDNYTTIWLSQWYTQGSYFIYNDICGPSGNTSEDIDWMLSKSQWARFEMYITLGTGGHATITMYKDTSSRLDIFDGDIDTFDEGRWFVWHTYWGNLEEPKYRDADIFADDHYFQWDNENTVIEICDASLWANRSHCEVQLPSLWSDTGATFTVNTGSFNNEDIAYLYVRNSLGDVNANGIEITIGGSANPAPTVSGVTANLKTFTITCSEDLVITGLDDGDFKANGSFTGNDIDLDGCTEDAGVITCTSAQTFNNYETITLDFYGGADEVEAADDGTDMETFSGTAVTNNTEAPFLKGTGGIVNGFLN